MTATRDDGQGWKRALALVLIVFASSVVESGVLIAIPLLVLIGLGGIRSVAVFFATVLAMLIVLSGPRDGLWYAERAWALLIGGAFAGLALGAPRWRLVSRAVAAVTAATGALVVFFGVRGGTWPVVEWTVTDRIRAGAATWMDVLRVARQGEAVPQSLVSMVYRSIEAQISVFPALLALQSIAALAVVWWLYVRLVHRKDTGVGALRGFRFNDHLVWLMIAGLVLIVLRAGDGVTRIGANLAVFMAALYAVRGTAVVVFVNDGLTWLGYVLFALGLLTAAPVVLGFMALLGIADTWLDLRARAASVAT